MKSEPRAQLSYLRHVVNFLIAGIVAVAICISTQSFCQEKPGGSTTVPGPSIAPEPQYLLFWRGPEQAAELIKTIGTQGDGRTRILGFGVPCSGFVQEKQAPELIHLAFAVARSNNLAVMLHFDLHVEWANRPDLWNFFAPDKPGYNPENRRNVEWFGWEGPAAEARYLNWGEVQRMPPPICFTSKAVRGEWSRLIRQVISPVIKKELASLQHDGKGRLFAGVLVGSEPTFDDYSHTDEQTAKRIAADKAPVGQLGYRALLDRGYSKAHPPEDIHKALGDIVQETVAFWCREFAESGLPQNQLYPHVPAGSDIETTSTPISAAFNAWSRPGWSTYPVGPLQRNFQPLYDSLGKNHSPRWGGVEANVGFPGTLVDWETYLAWHFNHGAALVGINTGATGTELPAMLEKSAFSPEALAAYRKFLSGGQLREKPISEDQPGLRIRRKMDILQAGFRKWQAAGRDPSAIAHFVEASLPTLLKENKLAEAEAVIDEAIKRVNSSAP